MPAKSNSIKVEEIREQKIVCMYGFGYEIKVNLTKGANLFWFRNEERGLDIVVEEEEEKQRPINFPHYGMPIIFPPNRIANGTFKIENKQFHFPINDVPGLNNHIHGLLYNEEWKLIYQEQSEEKCSIKLQYESTETSWYYKFYPYRFQIVIEFILNDNGFKKNIKVKNNGDSNMPFAIGVHPFFKIPFSKGGSKDDYYLKANVEKEWKLDENYMPSELIDLSETEKKELQIGIPIGEKAILHHYVSKKSLNPAYEPNSIEIVDKKSKSYLTYEVGKEYTHWMLWNGNGKDGYICLEPQTIMVNGFNLKDNREDTGFLLLSPGEQWKTYELISIKQY